MPTVLEVAEQFDAALLRKDAVALSKVIRTYGEIYQRLQDKIDALVLEIQARELRPNDVQRMTRYKELLAQTEGELDDFAGWLKTESGRVAAEAVKAGESDAARLVGATVTGRPVVLAGFNRLNPRAIQALLAFLDPAGPLYQRMKVLPGFTKEQVKAKLLEGIGLGYSPQKTAAAIRDALGGGLTDALRMTRTVQLYSYREASRASYIVNGDVVEGWYWHAHLNDTRTCASCWAMHGTFHTNDERLNDHHNGRCAPIPAVKGFGNPIDKMGEDAFNALPESKQREILGASKYEAWRGGKFSFDRLSHEQDDAVYGAMRTERPLRDLIQ